MEKAKVRAVFFSHETRMRLVLFQASVVLSILFFYSVSLSAIISGGR